MSGADLFVKNLMQFDKNRWHNALQNPMAFKDQALSIASLVLVVSRVLVANFSALRARGTSEGPYRYRESIRTDIREIAGWTFSFAVLRQVQKFIEKKLDAAMKVKVSKDPHVTSMKDDLWDLIGNNPIKKSMPQLGFIEKNKDKIQLPNFLKGVWKKEGVQNYFKKNEREFALFANKNLPMAVASVPSIILAGYVLEGFARDYCNQVVDSISKMLHGATGKKQPPTANSPHFGAHVGPHFGLRGHVATQAVLPLRPPVTPVKPRLSPYARQPQPPLFSGLYTGTGI